MQKGTYYVIAGVCIFLLGYALPEPLSFIFSGVGGFTTGWGIGKLIFK